MHVYVVSSGNQLSSELIVTFVYAFASPLSSYLYVLMRFPKVHDLHS